MENEVRYPNAITLFRHDLIEDFKDLTLDKISNEYFKRESLEKYQEADYVIFLDGRNVKFLKNRHGYQNIQLDTLLLSIKSYS